MTRPELTVPPNNSETPQAPGGPVLFEVAMKRFDMLWGGYQEHHRRATTIFGFSSFLAAGVLVVLDRLHAGHVPEWLCVGFGVVACAAYVAMAWQCYQAIRVRSFTSGAFVETKASAPQILASAPDVARTRISVNIERHNDEIRVLSNLRADAVQAATARCSILALLLFIGGVLSTLPQGLTMSSSPKPPTAPEAPSPPAPTPPPPPPDLTLLLTPFEEDGQVYKMSRDRPPKSPAK